MPKSIVPHRSGAHRIAAIALYRALVSQVKKLPEERFSQPELLNIIYNRFTGFRYCTSYRELKVYFEAGYEAVDHLDAAVAGDQKSTHYVQRLVEQTPKKSKEKRWRIPFRPPIPHHHESPSSRDQTRAISPPPPVLDREGKPSTTGKPYGSIFERARTREELGGTGKRHIPILFSANGIPVLRFTKPQPASLTRYLNAKIKIRQALRDKRDELVDTLLLARQEDEWDRIISRTFSVGETDDDDAAADDDGNDSSSITPFITREDQRWTKEYRKCLHGVDATIAKEREKNAIMAEKMHRIVERERELARKESMEDEAGLEEKERGSLVGLVEDIVGVDEEAAMKTAEGRYQPFNG